jgi:hypothetical protein
MFGFLEFGNITALVPGNGIGALLLDFDRLTTRFHSISHAIEELGHSLQYLLLLVDPSPM